MIHGSTRVSLLVLCLLLVTACAASWTYVERGANEASAPLVTVTCEFAHADSPRWGQPRIFITKIDEAFTYAPFRLLVGQVDYPQVARLRPGRHYLDVRYHQANTFADGSLWFDAERGKNYRVRTAVKGYGVQFWVEEEGSGKVVGGIPGSEPEKKQQLMPSNEGTTGRQL